MGIGGGATTLRCTALNSMKCQSTHRCGVSQTCFVTLMKSNNTELLTRLSVVCRYY